jgi:hypothetical protein
MPPDAAAVKLAHARRCLGLARQAESLAEDAEQNGPFKDWTGAEHFRAQAVSLRRQSILNYSAGGTFRTLPPAATSRRREGSARRRSRRVASGRRQARAPGSSDDGSSEGGSGSAAHSLDLLDAVAFSLGWVRAA